MATTNSGSIRGTISCRPGGRLSLDVASGFVEVCGREDAEAVVYEARGGQVEAWERGGTVRMEGRAVHKLHVEVPRQMDVHLRGNSSFRVAGIRGAVDVDARSGTVEVRDVEGSVRLETGSGDVSLESISGSVRIDAGSGRIRGRGLDGPIDVDSGSGSLILRRLGGGPVHVDTGSGPLVLEFRRAPTGAVHVDAGSGPVTIELPTGTAATLDLRGVSVDTAGLQGFKASRASRGDVRGEMNGGGVRIRVDASGPVRVRTGSDDDEAEEPMEPRAPDDLESPELKVLEMLAAGRITAEEADELIAALRGEPPAPRAPAERWASELESPREGAGEAAGTAADGAPAAAEAAPGTAAAEVVASGAAPEGASPDGGEEEPGIAGREAPPEGTPPEKADREERGERDE